MVVRTTDWITLEEGFPIDISDIKHEAIKFNDIIRLLENFDDEDTLDTIRDLQRANLHFTQAKNLVRNLMKPEDNDYISNKDAIEHYKWLIDSLGRADRRLDQFQSDISEKSETQALMKKSYSFIKVVSFYNFLQEAMQSLVYYPLNNAYKRWLNQPTKDKKDPTKKIVKDEELFIYFVFLEMYHAALSVGGLTREDVNRPSNQKGFSNSQPIGIPSNLPSNIKIEELSQYPEIGQQPQIDESALFGEDQGDDYV